MRQIAVYVLLGLFAGGSQAADATTMTSATVYLDVPRPNDATDRGNFGTGLPNASFLVGPAGLNFDAFDSYHTAIGVFLNNPVFTNAVSGFDPSMTIGFGVEVVFEGTLTLSTGDNVYSIGHDDGVVLNVGGYGTVVDQRGPSVFDPMSFDLYNAGPETDVPFTLDYAECCAGQAQLLLTKDGQTVGAETPEPSSLILLGTGILGLLGGAFCRRMARGR